MILHCLIMSFYIILYYVAFNMLNSLGFKGLKNFRASDMADGKDCSLGLGEHPT